MVDVELCEFVFIIICLLQEKAGEECRMQFKGLFRSWKLIQCTNNPYFKCLKIYVHNLYYIYTGDEINDDVIIFKVWMLLMTYAIAV